MAGLFEDPQLEAKKSALVAEAEIYRQTLRLEFHNLHLYGLTLKRKFSLFRAVGPVWTVASPLLRLLQWRRRKPPKTWWSRLAQGWQWYQRVRPAAAPLLTSLTRRR